MEAFQPTILRFESLLSTNDEAARRAGLGAPEGLCIVAAEQTAGRGRLQRYWNSPANAGLYLSVLLRPQLEPRECSLLPLMTALAVRRSLADACELEVDIKWPNDILAANRKLCGILIETIETGHGRAAIVGVGINLNRTAYPPELASQATSVAEETGRHPDPDTLLKSLLTALADKYRTFSCVGGGAAIREEWAHCSSYAHGKRVTIINGDETLEGVTRGLESDGALRVETNDGRIQIVRAGDVTSLRTPDN